MIFDRNISVRMKRSILKFILPFVSIVGCSSSQNSKLSSIDTFFIDKIDKGQLAGVVALVAKDGEIRHLKAYGYMDVENKTPMNTDVIIPVASMTKIITSIGILQLVEKGKLNLDDPIEKYIPEFRDMKVLITPESHQTEKLVSPPTIRDFLRHTSGMVYSDENSVVDSLYKNAGFREWNQPLHVFIEKLTNIPLAYQPGTKWVYSFSHDVLGYLIEVVSGITLDQYFDENIFRPLGLDNTGFWVPKEKSSYLSNLYIYENESLNINDSRNNSIYNQQPNALSGGGGWWDSYGGLLSTVTDFLTISNILLDFDKYDGKRILRKESVDMMIENQIGDLSAYGSKYGLGIGVVSAEDNPNETEEVFWSGSPYNTYFWVNYKKNLACILFTNTAPYSHLDIMNKFKEVVDKSYQ